MGEAAYTDEERRLLRRWRGLPNAVLEQLSGLDRDAIIRRDRFAAERELLIIERQRCIKVRGRLGLDHLARLSSRPS